ncbi:MAG: phasin family protein [Alphaproteobacteria bacterium]|nr:phasin family protein [Alphaproteobacteria bacterium]
MSEDSNFIPSFSNETLFSLMENYQGMPDAFQGFVDVQIKSLLSISKVHQSSVDDINKIAFHQQKVFSQIMEDTTTLANDMFKSADTQTALQVSAQSIEKSYESAMSNVNEVSELLRKSSAKTGSILRENAKQSMSELQNIQQKTSKASS